MRIERPRRERRGVKTRASFWPQGAEKDALQKFISSGPLPNLRMSLPSGRNHRPSGFGSLGTMARDSAGGAAPSRVFRPSPNSPAGMPGCLFPVRSQSTRHPFRWWDGGLPAPHFLSPVPVWIAPPLIPMLKPPVFMTFTGSPAFFPAPSKRWETWGYQRPAFWVHPVLGTPPPYRVFNRGPVPVPPLS